VIADPFTTKALGPLNLLDNGRLLLQVFSAFFLLLVDLIRLLNQLVRHFDVRRYDDLQGLLDQLVAHHEVQVLFI
jgi:hypothetical protein